ncbi:MAG: ATP-binding cassette domain-containing protein [Candidatus Eisenbacteria bacterium]|nr:ATP-binding cassette domain-containing protein [Candidatus Eisenbacteria bacterium]
MPLLGLNNVSLSFHGPLLLDGVTLQIDEGERLGLLGRNGAGKSTLLKVLEGSLRPDAGEVVKQQGLRIAGLQQDVPLDLAGTVRGYMLERSGALTSEHPWEIEAKIDTAIDQLGLEPEAVVATLSAGSKRRVLLATALTLDPDVLLLDEPTNHLDLGAILFLEEALARRAGALIFVTHDRSFLRRVATRIIDLDRGALRSYRTDYDSYVDKREEELRVEAEQAALFDKKLAQEEAWVRRGIKARRTRNEGRVRALQALRLERGARREVTGKASAGLQDAERSGRIVLKAERISYSYGDAKVVRDLSTTIVRGDRIGIIGPNGCGKTTLLKLLLGELSPQSGEIRTGVRVETAHFEQLHDVLDEAKSVVDNVADGREMLTIGGAERHVVGYLRDFLFTPEQIQGPVLKLSGGERKRLQLARILSRPSNLLVLDEPTNDLDLETLELMEDLLLEFQGTLLVVSHDREFLNNVVTSTLAYDGDGAWSEYIGGYDDWVRQRKSDPYARPNRRNSGAPRERASSSDQGGSTPEGMSRGAEPTLRKPKRLGFKETRELEALPGKIDALEAEKETLFKLLGTPTFYTTRADEVASTKERLAAIELELHFCMERWVELESIRAGEAG